jgi:CRP/FNR family cyclic AMP-dependent transcriptional regulator
MLKNQGKKVVVIVASDPARKAKVETMVTKHVQDVVIYSAQDYLEAIQKVKNVPPLVVFAEYELPKGKGGQLMESIIADEELKQTSMVVLSPLPRQERFLDELVTGRVQFLDDSKFDQDFGPVLSMALAFSTQSSPTDFFLKFIKPNDLLVKEGDKGDQVYILKKGQLRAFQTRQGQKIELGLIEAGEFVGEMAYFNGEPRIASVEAVTDCELIEIPIGTFERVLYQRPAWSRALLQTLSRRLKKIEQSKT